MDDAALSGEVRFATPRCIIRRRHADFEIGADGDVKPSDEGGTVAAKILAGSFYLEGNAARIAAADAHRQADGNSTFRALARDGRAGERDHGLGPHFWRPRRLGPQKSVPRFRGLRWAFAPPVRFGEARCRFPRHE